jgi:hypothetical protein
MDKQLLIKIFQTHEDIDHSHPTTTHALAAMIDQVEPQARHNNSLYNTVVIQHISLLTLLVVDIVQNVADPACPQWGGIVIDTETIKWFGL